MHRIHEAEIKFLRSDVAIVFQYHERKGQVINEMVAPTRKINTSYMITKENRTWLLRHKSLWMNGNDKLKIKKTVANNGYKK